MVANHIRSLSAITTDFGIEDCSCDRNVVYIFVSKSLAFILIVLGVDYFVRRLNEQELVSEKN